MYKFFKSPSKMNFFTLM
uniref:Uncharacterized protein n=1 Tax=Anguilla anguilla TaxID=7936 RepID=A0A0E9SPA4_ANGAN